MLFFITLSAGAVLVLLAGRRLWHRFRGQPDRADLDRLDPIDVAIAYAKDADEAPRAMSRSAGADEPAGPTDRGPTDRGPTDRGPTDRGPTDRGPTDREGLAGSTGGEQ